MPIVAQCPSSLCVGVFAHSRETIDALHRYFQGAGVVTHTAGRLRDMAKVAAACAAIVIFPDEFKAKDVINRILALRASQPTLLIVVVTSTPQHLYPAVEPDGHSHLPMVIPKPAFGWAILDAIRAHINAVPL